MVQVGVPAQVAGVAGTLPEDYRPELKVVLLNALRQSPPMLLQNAYLAQSEAGRYLSDSILWPNLLTTAGYGLYGAKTTSNPPSISSTSGLTYGISLGQPIFQWGAYKAQSDIAKLSQQVTERQYADAFRGLVTSLRYQYLGLITKKVSLRFYRFQLKLQEASLAAQEEQLKAGSLSEGDVIGPRLAVLEARLNLDRYVQDYDYGKRIFMRLAGLDRLEDESIPADLARPPYSSDAAQSLLTAFLGGGAEETLQGQIYVLTLKQNDLTYRIAKTSQYFPKFSLAAGYSLSNSSVFQPGSAVATSGITYNYGISAYLPLFNGFYTRGYKLSALATRRSTEQTLRNYLGTTADTAQNLRRQLDFLARALDLAETRRALAQDAVKKITEQVNEGTLAQSALEGTTAGFYYADYIAINARAEYLNRWSDFVSFVGVDPILSALPARYLNLSHGK